MRHWLKLQDAKSRAVVFGLLPCALGLGAARTVLWTDTVWLTTAGSFWPIILSSISGAILNKLSFFALAERRPVLARPRASRTPAAPGGVRTAGR